MAVPTGDRKQIVLATRIAMNAKVEEICVLVQNLERETRRRAETVGKMQKAVKVETRFKQTEAD